MQENASSPLVASRKSPFIHKMDRTPPGIVCPTYYVLSHGNGCPYGCDYCCLQLPLRNIRKPIVFDGRERMLEELRRFLGRGRAWLLSAGESSDSLALDHVTHLARDLVPLFARQDEGMLFPKEKQHKLLFVTKSANVQGLLEVNERANVVVSFSLNAPEVSALYEHGAPHPYERLKAAVRCQQAGYEVRIRIDPIIPLEGWCKMYEPLLERIESEMDVEGLRFTIGAIRHNPGLRECARERGREWKVFSQANSREASDLRYRLPVALRREVYGWFLEHLPGQATVALCKETEELWNDLGLDSRNPRCNCAL